MGNLGRIKEDEMKGGEPRISLKKCARGDMEVESHRGWSELSCIIYQLPPIHLPATPTTLLFFAQT